MDVPAEPLIQSIESMRLGDRVLGACHRLGIRRAMDILNHFPRQYSRRATIATLRAGDTASVVGTVLSATNKASSRRRMQLTEVLVRDETGTIKAVFFNQPWLTGRLQPGLRVKLTGNVDYAYNSWAMKPSSYEINPPEQGAGLEPEYPLTQGLENTEFANLVQLVLPHAEAVPDPLPEKLAATLRLMPVGAAYHEAHRPTGEKPLQAARLALKYREFFLLQAGLRMRRRAEARDTDMVLRIDDDLRARARKYFPFDMTAAQQRVCTEIEGDLTSPGRMHRLVQGDVGSGKTAVALYAALLHIDNGYQVALMAPTEVLARQHFRSLTEYLRKSKVEVALLLGGMKKSERDTLCADLESGRIHILVGTHALIEDYVRFRKLGLCVIDEQHKFGVNQRAALRAKGSRPHVLAMSATPIPRTLSMTLYGALDVSVIDELPPGRTPVITEWVHRSREAACHERIRKELREGGRAYFIYPLVDESDKVEMKSAVEFAETLKNRDFADFRVGLVHGQMPADEKDRAMDLFRRGQLDILAATVVVEVGVDVPEANVMVIENAENFGLAQLHQLRGRVGRGRRQSYLFLFGEPRSQDAVKRLQIICSTNDGFKIAEEDLKMRGFGDFAGTRQSGLPKLHIGDFEADYEALGRARMDAAKWAAQIDELLIRKCLDLHFGRKHRLLDV